MITEELLMIDELETASGLSIECITQLFAKGYALQYPGYISMSDLNKQVAPLTLEELIKLVWDDSNTYIGQHIWVKDLNFGVVLACVLDAYADGIVAVYGANDKEEWFFEKDYGKTWVAYLEEPK